MGEMNFPPEIRQWIAKRLAEGYADETDYVIELIRRDMAQAALPETPEYVAWVREKVAEGLASGVIEAEPEDVIEEIIAERRARRG